MNTLTTFRRTIRLAAWLAVVAMCVVPASSRAQEQPAPPPQPQAASPAEQQPAVVIKKESKLVLVDSVVTDKKGNYIRDLTQNDFKVFEDNKEQQVSTFSTGADAATQANGQRRYLILFFDNSTMAAPDQIQARNAAKKFIEANAGPDRLMPVVDSGGFALTQENQSELTATIDACNKSNVAVYALDARGLVATAPGGSAGRRAPAGRTRAVSNRVPTQRISPRRISARTVSSRRVLPQTISPRPHLILAAFPAMAMPDPQRPGGGGTGGGGTGGGGGRGGTGGGGTGGGGGRGGTGGGGTGGGG